MKAQHKNTISVSPGKKSKYYGLDEVGIVGTQEKKSLRSEIYYTKKIGNIFRAARKAEQKIN